MLAGLLLLGFSWLRQKKPSFPNRRTLPYVMRLGLCQTVLQYGLLKERMAALYTDGIRAEILENHGYRTQILEFIDMEHTPKNVLIRAVKEGKGKKNGKKLQEMMEFLHVENTLAKEIGIQM